MHIKKYNAFMILYIVKKIKDIASRSPVVLFTFLQQAEYLFFISHILLITFFYV